LAVIGVFYHTEMVFKTRKPLCLQGFSLVAGTGLEPVTFGL